MNAIHLLENLNRLKANRQGMQHIKILRNIEFMAVFSANSRREKDGKTFASLRLIMKKDYAIRMRKLIWFLLGSLVILLLGCSSENPALDVPPGGQYFTVQVGNDAFVMYVTDEASIRLATENFQGKNRTFPSGRIEQGHAGYNFPWSWHFIPQSIRMVEASIEVCDGAPSYVETHINDFVAVGYCPWGAKVIKLGR